MKLNPTNTVWTRNKEQTRSFPYCEATGSSFIKFNFGKHRHSVIMSFYTIAESPIESSLRISGYFSLIYVENPCFI